MHIYSNHCSIDVLELLTIVPVLANSTTNNVNLTFNEASVEDAGLYACIALTNYTSANITANITVISE